MRKAMFKLAGGKSLMVFLLAIIGMTCWGIAPIFVKVGLKNINPILGLSIRTMVTAVFITGWMIVDGSISNLKNISSFTVFLLAIEAILATLIGDLSYFAAVKKGSVTLVTIIMSSSPLVTMICAVLFLGEQITTCRVIGAGLIIIGITLTL
jgi:transporter family protein